MAVPDVLEWFLGLMCDFPLRCGMGPSYQTDIDESQRSGIDVDIVRKVVQKLADMMETEARGETIWMKKDWRKPMVDIVMLHYLGDGGGITVR